MNIRASAVTALRQNEKKQMKLVAEARKLREFLLALGGARRRVVHRKKRRKLKAVK